MHPQTQSMVLKKLFPSSSEPQTKKLVIRVPPLVDTHAEWWRRLSGLVRPQVLMESFWHSKGSGGIHTGADPGDDKPSNTEPRILGTVEGHQGHPDPNGGYARG